MNDKLVHAHASYHDYNLGAWPIPWIDKEMSSRWMQIQGFLSNQVTNMNVKCNNTVMKWNYIFTQGDKCFKIMGKSFQYSLCELPKWELWHSKNCKCL